MCSSKITSVIYLHFLMSRSFMKSSNVRTVLSPEVALSSSVFFTVPLACPFFEVLLLFFTELLIFCFFLGPSSSTDFLFLPLCVVGTDSSLSISIGVGLLVSFHFSSFLGGLLLDPCCGEELSVSPPIGMVIIILLDFLPIYNWDCVACFLDFLLFPCHGLITSKTIPFSDASECVSVDAEVSTFLALCCFLKIHNQQIISM